MTTTDIRQAINQRLEELTIESQQRVLSFVESLDTLSDGLTLEQMKPFCGSISPEDAALMRQAIEDEFERVDDDA